MLNGKVKVLWCYFDQVEQEPVCGICDACAAGMQETKAMIRRMAYSRIYPGSLMVRALPEMAFEEWNGMGRYQDDE